VVTEPLPPDPPPLGLAEDYRFTRQHTDCGLRHLPADVARAKLAAMVEGTVTVRRTTPINKGPSNPGPSESRRAESGSTESGAPDLGPPGQANPGTDRRARSMIA
jgi:hypothetical protein